MDQLEKLCRKLSMIKAIQDFHRGDVFTQLQRLKELGTEDGLKIIKMIEENLKSVGMSPDE